MTAHPHDWLDGTIVRLDHVVGRDLVRDTHPGPDGEPVWNLSAVYAVDLDARHAERVARPRPVRPGDTVCHFEHGRARFIAQDGGYVIAALIHPDGRRSAPEVWTDQTAWTHENGNPIDWDPSF